MKGFLAVAVSCSLSVPLWAQTAPLPAPPLVVPIAPAPLDAKSQSALDANRSRSFAITLRNVAPSVMAFWLDAAHNELPSRFQNVPQALHPPLPWAYRLPEGVDRVVAIDAQSMLLVTGTPKSVGELRETITFLDQPALFPVSAPLSVEFQATVFWLDSLAPTTPAFAQSALRARVATPAELLSFERMANEDRASRSLLPSRRTPDKTATMLPFAPAAHLESEMPNPARTPAFAAPVPMPGSLRPSPLFPRADIDPGIQAHGLMPQPPKIGEVVLTPLLTPENGLVVQVQLAGAPSGFVSVSEGESLIVSGSARKMGLTPPSPRFDAFILRITPRVRRFAPSPQPAQ